MTDQENFQIISGLATRLRKKLHRSPELSGQESRTYAILKEFFDDLNPSHYYENIGGNSVAWEFSSENPEITVVFRADTDALPIPDEINTTYTSEIPGTGHKCGHDGHMAILAGFARILEIYPPRRSRIILLFQAEEETGSGAEKVVNHDWFKKLKPHYVFGLHNLPGFEKGNIIMRNGHFACASTGMKIKLKGRSSHAGHPEDGVNPAMAISRMIRFINLEVPQLALKHFFLATIIHIRLGDAAFGTSPGMADFMITLRAEDEYEMDKLIEEIRNKVLLICENEGLAYKISFTERFPSTVNHENGYNKLQHAARKASLKIHKMDEAFRWSEDFGHYLKHAKGAFFGLGAGTNIPKLHNPDYDFPDDIIESGIKIFTNLYKLFEE